MDYDTVTAHDAIGKVRIMVWNFFSGCFRRLFVGQIITYAPP